MKSRPRITHGERFMHVTFGFPLTRAGDDPEAELADIPRDDYDLQEQLEAFIESAHEQYYERYAKQTNISEATRRVDPEQLAAIILAQYEAAKREGDCEVCLHFSIEQRQNPSEIGQELINYTLHWHTETQDIVDPVFPIGYQLFYSYRRTKEALIGTLVFDTRVTNKQLESSREFYIDKCLPGLVDWFDYLKGYFEQVSKNDYNVDVNAARTKLAEVLEEYYDRRLNNPNDCRRLIVFMDAKIIGEKPSEFIIQYDVRVTTEQTSTPDLLVSHEDHRTIPIQQDDIVASFASTRTALDDEPIEIPVTANQVPSQDVQQVSTQ